MVGAPPLRAASIRPAAPASSSSTTSACSTCAGTAPSAWPSRSRTWGGSARRAPARNARRRRRLHEQRRQPGHDPERAQLSLPRETCRVGSTMARTVDGDIAWGGNWFFLMRRPRPESAAGRGRAPDRFHAGASASALVRDGITGADNGEIDHIELFGPPAVAAEPRPQLRALPRQGLRPLAVRHRHQRQARLPARRRQARRRPGLAAGEHHRHRLRGHASASRRQGHPAHHRLGLRQWRGDPDPRPRRPFEMGIRA